MLCWRGAIGTVVASRLISIEEVVEELLLLRLEGL
jgi:hypothetical protein